MSATWIAVQRLHTPKTLPESAGALLRKPSYSLFHSARIIDDSWRHVGNTDHTLTKVPKACNVPGHPFDTLGPLPAKSQSCEPLLAARGSGPPGPLPSAPPRAGRPRAGLDGPDPRGRRSRPVSPGAGEGVLGTLFETRHAEIHIYVYRS